MKLFGQQRVDVQRNTMWRAKTVVRIAFMRLAGKANTRDLRRRYEDSALTDLHKER